MGRDEDGASYAFRRLQTLHLAVHTTLVRQVTLSVSSCEEVPGVKTLWLANILSDLVGA